MIGLPYGEKNYDDMLSHFHPTPERHGRTDRRTDGQTGMLYQYRASVCWRAIKIGVLTLNRSNLSKCKILNLDSGGVLPRRVEPTCWRLDGRGRHAACCRRGRLSRRRRRSCAAMKRRSAARSRWTAGASVTASCWTDGTYRAIRTALPAGGPVGMDRSPVAILMHRPAVTAPPCHTSPSLQHHDNVVVTVSYYTIGPVLFYSASRSVCGSVRLSRPVAARTRLVTHFDCTAAALLYHNSGGGGVGRFAGTSDFCRTMLCISAACAIVRVLLSASHVRVVYWNG